MKFSNKPMKEQRTQLLALAAIVVGGGAYWYSQTSGPAEFSSATSKPAASVPNAPVGAGGQSGLPSALKFAALEPVGDKPAASRNPFRFYVPPPPPPPPRPVTPPPAPVVQAPQPQVPVGPPPPPAISLKFVGAVQLPNGKRVASLSDGKGVMLGTEGDVIDGRFRIVKIGMESIVMEYLDGRGRQTIPLRGSL